MIVTSSSLSSSIEGEGTEHALSTFEVVLTPDELLWANFLGEVPLLYLMGGNFEGDINLLLGQAFLLGGVSSLLDLEVFLLLPPGDVMDGGLSFTGDISKEQREYWTFFRGLKIKLPS